MINQCIGKIYLAPIPECIDGKTFKEDRGYIATIGAQQIPFHILFSQAFHDAVLIGGKNSLFTPKFLGLDTLRCS